MNIRVRVTEDSGIWRGQISLEPGGLTAAETASLAAHGPFTVDAGGSFDGDGLDDVSLHGITFELEENAVQLPDKFPVIQEFDAWDSLDVEMGPRAAIWAERMRERIEETLVAWLDLSEAWERDTLHTLPET